jgi:hypothetical protein
VAASRQKKVVPEFVASKMTRLAFHGRHSTVLRLALLTVHSEQSAKVDIKMHDEEQTLKTTLDKNSGSKRVLAPMAVEHPSDAIQVTNQRKSPDIPIPEQKDGKANPINPA